jgi:hypothetical protein
MPTQINGLPAHVLLVHAVVILVPVAALLLVAQAWSRPVRRWAGIGGPLLCLGAVVLVPITTSAGEWFRDHMNPDVAASAAVRRHAELGDQLLPWVVALFVLSVAVWWLGRRSTAGLSAPLISVVVAALATVAAAGSIYSTVRIGDSGAQAVWKGQVVDK